MERKRGQRHSAEFRRMAVERVRAGHRMTAVAKDLGVHRVLLHHWVNSKDPEHPFSRKTNPATGSIPEPRSLLEELQESKRMLAEKTLEVDFFRGALQKVEARRQRNGNSGAMTSTTKSGK